MKEHHVLVIILYILSPSLDEFQKSTMELEITNVITQTINLNSIFQPTSSQCKNKKNENFKEYLNILKCFYRYYTFNVLLYRIELAFHAHLELSN